MNSKRIGLFGPIGITSHLAVMMALACPSTPAQDLRTLLGTFRAYDRAPADGTVEVNDIRPAVFEPNPGLVPSPTTPLLLVVINPDVLTATGSYSDADLAERLRDYHRHLRRDGFTPYFVTADLYKGGIHQDGQTLLIGMLDHLAAHVLHANHAIDDRHVERDVHVLVEPHREHEAAMPREVGRQVGATAAEGDSEGTAREDQGSESSLAW